MTELSERVVLDREVRFDEASKNYPVRQLLTGRKPRSYTWRHVQLDQNTYRCGQCKQLGACTGYSATMEAAARPQPVFGSPWQVPSAAELQTMNVAAHEIYHRAKQLDVWAGENYEGSSVLGAVKAGQEKGWWDSFRWGLGPGPEKAAQDVFLSLGYLGPVILGSHWRGDMWKANADGFLRFSGSYEGGHAWLLTAVNVRRDAVWTPNSWGGEGQGWVSRKDLIALLAEDGEACVVQGRKK